MLAGEALIELTGRALPPPRMARVSALRTSDGALLDRALVLWFPQPASATGEDCVELHLHGGRAVVAAVLDALGASAGLRAAEPGEFTRRAFENGRIDLAQAEGIGELVRAETEAQRRSAVAQATGGLSRLIGGWDDALVQLAAQIEVAIDFSDEDDVTPQSLPSIIAKIAALSDDIAIRLGDPPAERMRDGVRIVLIGAPNAGKSTLLNRLVARDAAIVSPRAGTTRDVIEIPVDLHGLPLVFIDTAGVRDTTDDEIERAGIVRALGQAVSADIVLALSDIDITGTARIIRVHAKCDVEESCPGEGGFAVSALTGAGMAALIEEIKRVAACCLPLPDRIALNQRHRAALIETCHALSEAQHVGSELLIAEHLRIARLKLGKVTGTGDVESMLDALFGTFCIGK